MPATTNSAKITASGLVTLRGALSDDHKFKSANTLAKTGDYPFYLPLGNGSEVVIGWLAIPARPSNAVAGNLACLRTGTNALATTVQAAPLPP